MRFRDRGPREPRVTVAAGIRLVTFWHLFGVVAGVTSMLLASRTGDDELPVAIKLLMQVFSIVVTVAHVIAAYGTFRGVRRARTVSLVTNYLLFVVAASALLHQVGAFTAIGKFGTGLNKAFLPFLVIVVGLLWVLVAGQLLAKRPHAAGPTTLRKAGWGLAAVATVWFVIVADPSGMLSTLGDRITQPITIGTAIVAIGAGVATRFMWQRRVAVHFGTSAAEEQTLSGLAFLSPNLIGFLFFFAGPLLFSLVVSFFEWKTTGTGRTFVGIDNYVRVMSLDLSSADAANAGNEVLKPGYQVLMHLDWFGQNWVLGARDTEFWISLRNIFDLPRARRARRRCSRHWCCRASSPHGCPA